MHDVAGKIACAEGCAETISANVLKVQQCEDYSEQSKLFSALLTFAKLRCLFKLEYFSLSIFDFVCLHFH